MTMPNMSVEGMKEWKQTAAYEEYAEYHEKNIESGTDTSLEQVTHRALQVIMHGESSKYADKVKGYNARALAAFGQLLGGDKIPVDATRVLTIANDGTSATVSTAMKRVVEGY